MSLAIVLYWLAVGAAIFVAGMAFGLSIAEERLSRDKPKGEFLHCFMRDLKAGRYERK